MKRILTIQDISCVGKCSLTVAIPIISAFGIETAVLPTAVLSTHTAFSGFTFRDLTSDIPDIAKHWKEQNINFDAIYTGYLGSKHQIDLVKDIFNEFKKNNNLIIVDPVMADNGKLYTGFDKDFAKHMSNLCALADIIVPNLTEASYLLDLPYIGDNYDENYVRLLLKKLTDLGAKKAILTGICLDGEHLGVYGYDKDKNQYYSYFRNRVPASFHGTGDVFASSLCGALSIDKSFSDALKIAVDFTVESISKTLENKNHNWYGVDFESALPNLIKQLY